MFVGKDWKPSLTFKQILLGIQDLLNDPNPNSPAQTEPYMLFKNNRSLYNQKIKEQARRFRPAE